MKLDLILLVKILLYEFLSCVNDNRAYGDFYCEIYSNISVLQRGLGLVKFLAKPYVYPLYQDWKFPIPVLVI